MSQKPTNTCKEVTESPYKVPQDKFMLAEGGHYVIGENPTQKSTAFPL